MTECRFTIHAFVVFLALICRADTNLLDEAILSFPNIGAGEFRPEQAVLSANALIAAGRNSACSALETVARAFPEDYEVGQKVCHLCRVLFVPRTEGRALRPPRLGAPPLLPLHSMNDADWPCMPLAIVENVPLSITPTGYLLEGIAEKPDHYLAYCLSNGTFRTLLFPTPSPATASNALQEILVSPAWKAIKWKDAGVGWSYALSEDYARKALWTQIERMANPQGGANGRQPFGSVTNRGSAAAAARRSPWRSVRNAIL